MASPIINIKFLADLKQFSSQMQNSQRSLKKTGAKFQSIGNSLSANFTAPVLAGIALVTKGTEELRSDLGRLETNTLTAGESFDFIKDQLKDVNAVTGEVDSSVEGLSNLLAAGFSGDALTEVLESVSGAAIKFSDTLKFEGVSDGLQETLATGKAIGPFAELLERSGLNLDNFNRGLQASIKSGTQQNFVLQTLASTGLADVNAKFRENNKDVVDARKAQLDFQLALADLGRIVQPIATQLLSFGTKLISYFTELSPTTKKFIVVLGGIAAAVGPLLALAGTILPAISAGFAILTGPIGLVIAALVGVGAVIAKYWDPIKQTAIDIANYFIDLYNESVVVRVGVEGIGLAFKNAFEVGKFAFEVLKGIIKGFIDQTINNFKSVGAIIKAAFTGNFKAIPGIIKDATKNSKQVFGGFTDELAADWETLTSNMKQNGQEALAAITTRNKIEFIEADVDASGVSDAVSKATAEGVVNGLSGISNQLPGRSNVSTEQDLEMAELDSEMAELDDIDALVNVDLASAEAESQAFFGSIRNQYEDFINATEEELVAPYEEKLQRMQEVGELVGSSVAGAFENLSTRVVDSLGLANEGFQGFVKGLVSTITKLISMMLAQSISQAIAGATASGTATGPAAIFATPGFIATAVGGVLAAFAAIPKFNFGGTVGGSSYYGDKILARVNSGELILNQQQQKELYNQLNTPTGIMAGEPLVLDARISGEDIILVQDRAQRSLDRQS